ncbi:MAG: 16S rRNA (adenine(1518)-N(6)/adenine(1519)-N(6))-dimethyltransferase RsmA [Mycoplasmatales bacterium]
MAQANIHTIRETKLELKKSLGQNFLTDSNIVNKIVKTACLNKDTTVIEIGPGIGALTEVMVKQAKNVLAIEIDQRLIPILEQNITEGDFTVINEDFLKIDNEQILPYIKGSKVKVVANLPYYITTAIITKILLEMPFIDELYIMVQKEVADRICAVPCTKKYNSLSVFCQTISDVNYEFTVKRTVFNPPPNVDSAIISFKRKNFYVDIPEFEKFVQNCFKQKRKTLINNLNAAYHLDKSIIIEFLEINGYTINTRSEEISIENFIVLFEVFRKEFL